ncbi:MAG: CBS domain-containing protein [Methanococcoides sp.]|jgi:CBS domain-containing protein|uniref:CBS domain-containing protein n=1 Tax=Methanococcoides seepicolus TaxID=2828780 RepID=A0A9E5DD02_9EURY|nr:CBS domain-containing protein [Methanococcoides seepicolus]MCM1987613.1 CBS domain-containing protein [Methanococcoides seepicolus]NOQ47821.1 CBS domain-containing protein [Methanococcoides sp.]
MPKETLVRDIMVKDVACVSLPGSRDEVLSILKDKKVSGLPVIKDNKLVGIVSRSNLLKKPTEEQLALLMVRDPVSIGPEEDITVAARLLLKHGIRRLPVVEGEKLVGLITVADVVGSLVDLNITTPISEYLNSGVGPVWYETPLPVVARNMELAHVKAVPVIDTNLDIVGLITDRDIISASVIEDSVEVSNMSAGADDDEWTWESMRDTMSIYYSVSRIKVPSVPVKDVMVKELISASSNMGVSECALKMKRNRIDQVPVVNANQKFIGLLRDRYLLKAILNA